ncbi:bifunctional UDP-sugar hydrolase/5'-nucleotidase [uncultured Shewanella sp.]|uniref:bifunctional metallophosphatase/5'-nucleotidase n=1 Tax=uncultured Shewanella sp. TaxID=173975 RepID=UPI0026165FF4|nr:bifunctional metallophosphatase/5'-nucleotidase [uncultured Shewanella sp.]
MNKKLLKGLVATAVLTALAGCGSDDNNKNNTESGSNTFNLAIAHINDTHSNFDATSLDFTAQVEDADFDVRTSVGGYPRIAKKLKEAREAAEDKGLPFLALHGGDAFQGSLYFSVLKGEGNAKLLSEMGLDASALGNHEFDLGNEALIEFANNINYPILAANLDMSADASMSGVDNILPYTVKELNGERVGIFGLVLEDMPSITSPGEDLVFNGEVETAQATVDTLVAEGVDKIIMVSHIGLDRDIRIAESVNGVDVIVGGHSHTRLGDFTNLGLGHGSATASYAQMFTNPDGTGQTCIVQAGEKAEAVGGLEVSFTDGAVTECAGTNVLLIDNDFQHEYVERNPEELTAEDQQAVEAFVNEQSNIAFAAEDEVVRQVIDTEYKPLLEAFESTVVGNVSDINDPTNTAQLDHVRIPGVARGGASLAGTGSEAGAQVATSMVWKLNQQGYGVDMAITNNGGVRDHITAGPDGLTAGYVVGSLLYFNNELAIVELLGSDVRSLLEYTINYGISNSTGAFPTFANLEFTFNGLAIEGEQIEGLNVCPGGVDAGNCAAIEDDKVYKVTTNAYIAGGKDGYDMLATHNQSELVLTGFVDNEVMIEYVEMLAASGKALEEISTGLTFIAPADLVIDDPLNKPEDNQ